MPEPKNVPQEVVDDLLTDPDRDAEAPRAPAPPRTIADEPGEKRRSGA